MGIFDTPGRLISRDYGDIYRQKADRLAEEGRFFLRLGRLEEAEEKSRQLIGVQAKVVGERHPDYASGLTLLAEIMLAREELSDAETLLQRSLEIRKKSLGDRHPDYATSLDLLARLMLRWEDYTGAEPLLRKALEIRRAVLGEDHPDYALSLSILADVVSKSDEFVVAEPLLRDAITTLTRIRGENHTDVADAYSNLAELLKRQGELTEAESLFRHAIEIFRQVHGETHHSYVTNLTSLASLLHNRGDFDGAEPIWRLLLDMRRQSLGNKHAECAYILIQIAQILQRQGNLADAESHFREAANIRKSALGERHPEYATSLTYLAFVLQRLGDLQGAEPLLRQALAIRKDVLGIRNPEYGTSLMNLALLVQKRGDVTWAKMLMKEAVEVRRAVFGENHPDFAQCLVALGEILAQQGELAKAESMIRQALEIRADVLGEYHPIYAANLCSLAAVLRKQGDFDEAENLLRHALHIRKEVIGEQHPDFATNLGNLAWLLQRKGDRKGAEQLLSQALDVRRETLGVNHPDVQQNLERLKSLQDPDAAPGLIEETGTDAVNAEAVLPRITDDVVDEYEQELDENDDVDDDALDSLEDEGSAYSNDLHSTRQGDHDAVSSCSEGIDDDDDALDSPFASMSEVQLAEDLGHHQDDATSSLHSYEALSSPEFEESIETLNESPDDGVLWSNHDSSDHDHQMPFVDEFNASDPYNLRNRDLDDESQPVNVHDDESIVEDSVNLENSIVSFSDRGADDGLEVKTLSDCELTEEFEGVETAISEEASETLVAQSFEVDGEEAVDRQCWNEVSEIKALGSISGHDVAESPCFEDEVKTWDDLNSSRIEDDVPLESESTAFLTEDATPSDCEDRRTVFAEDSAETNDTPANHEETTPFETVSEVHVEPVQDNLAKIPTSIREHEISAETTSRPTSLRSDFMSQTSSDLTQELSGLSDRFSELGEKLLAAARSLHAPGSPPSEELLDSIAGCRRDFLSFRQKTQELAERVGIQTSHVDHMNSLQEVSTLLDQVAEVELHQSKNEDLRRRGISVLDRVLAIQHTGASDFAPLLECQDKARELRQTFEHASWNALPAEVEQMSEGEHHFAHLLSLIEDHDELGDDLWASHHTSVGEYFGKPLAAAAARSKLVIQQPSGMALVGR